jgi:hypothetical protein
MPLNFPNMSRSFDATRRAVHFWGYDRVMESSFFVTEDALRDLQPNVNVSEAGLLNVFDSHRALICEIASKVYARGRKGSYVLVTADF